MSAYTGPYCDEETRDACKEFREMKHCFITGTDDTLCGTRAKNPNHHRQTPPDNACPICLALWKDLQ